jgi:hypothetical protein
MTDIVRELANYDPQELFEVLIGMIMESGTLEAELQQEASGMLGEAADNAAANGAKENERLLRLAELAIGGGTGAAPSAGTLRTLLSLHQIAKQSPAEAPSPAAVVDTVGDEVPEVAPSGEAVHEETTRDAGSNEAPTEEAVQLVATEALAPEVRKRARKPAQPAKTGRKTKQSRQS